MVRLTERAFGAVVAVTLGALALAGCSAASDTPSHPHASSTHPATGGTDPAKTSSAPVSTSAAPVPAVITATPGSGTSKADPAQPARVSVAHGTLTSVSMLSSSGKHIPGKLSAGGATWTSSEQLGFGRTYRITAEAKNSVGTTVTKKSTFDTVDPSQQTTPAINTLDNYYAIEKNATYGVAMVPDIAFKATVANKKAAQDAITITTTPHVAGAFYWTSGGNGDEVHWRPEHYWKPGTKVTITAKEYGVDLGHGLYGGDDVATSFTIGPDNLTVADDTASNETNPKTADHVYVYHSGKLVRTMLTSMGQHGGETVSGTGYINFYTLNGNYTVLDHENPAIMSSQSYGLPAGSPHGYGKLSVPYSTKISSDGIYLHEFNSTRYDQENGNDVSEGCLNLTTADASWFYDHTRVGDPVVVHGAKGAPTIAEWEGGDWSVPWSTWTKGGTAA